MAIFFTLLAWLSPMIFDPFVKLFEERERRIVGAAEEAKRLTGSAEETASAIEKRTQEAQADARRVLNDFRTQAQAREAEIIRVAREKATARIDEARAELFEASEDTRKKLKEDAKALSNEIVQKVLGRAA